MSITFFTHGNSKDVPGHHAMKIHVMSCGTYIKFLKLGLDRGAWSASHSRSITPMENTDNNYWMGGWLYARILLDEYGLKRSYHASHCHKLNNRFPVHYSQQDRQCVYI